MIGRNSCGGNYVDMIFRPAGRFLILPRPPGLLAARFLAAVILPPRVFFAILFTSFCTVDKFLY